MRSLMVVLVMLMGCGDNIMNVRGEPDGMIDPVTGQPACSKATMAPACGVTVTFRFCGGVGVSILVQNINQSPVVVEILNRADNTEHVNDCIGAGKTAGYPVPFSRTTKVVRIRRGQGALANAVGCPANWLDFLLRNFPVCTADGVQDSDGVIVNFQ